MKINKYIAIFAVMALILGFSGYQASAFTVDSSSEAAQDGQAGVTSNPSTQPAQDGPAGVSSGPSSDSDQDGPAGVVSSPSSELDQDSFTSPPVNPPSGGTPPGTGGPGSVLTVGGPSGPSATGPTSTSSLTGGTLTFTTTSCPLITEYMKFGNANNPLQVTNLQIFLKNSQKLEVDVNGIFDLKTENAVKAFQAEYLPEILGPWGADQASGFVYITTTKKINALACASPVVISAEEQAIIDAYKARREGGESTESVGPDNTNGTTTVEIGDATSEDNIAAVGGASILSRFWNFIKNLFR